MLFELVLILSLGSEQAPIENMRVLAIRGDCRMDFTGIDTCRMQGAPLLVVPFLPFWQVRAKELIGSDGFILLPCPVNDHGLRERPGPLKQERIIATTIGQAQGAFGKFHGRAFILDTEVPFTPTWRMRVRIGFVALTPGLK